MPGGLSAEALGHCAPDTAYLASEGWSGESDRARGIYLYIPCHFEKGIGKPDYRRYFEAYVKPQNEAWVAEKALAGWSMHLNQHAAGAPWDALILYGPDPAPMRPAMTSAAWTAAARRD